jgi:BirA family transcriptional regulator, biotin operon repressor / biotin---[acetyl-CoA-carboxylase] ligase
MHTADRILALLYDLGEGYTPPEDLASTAGVSRRRLEAALEQLAQAGHEFERSPAHGLRLRRPVKLNGFLVERALETRRVGRSVICFDQVNSTNDVAMDSARQGDTDGLVVLAESQKSGRGRQGRHWRSRPGANVLMSILLLGEDSPPQEALTIAAGLAVAEGIGQACGLDCQLRWPNDVLLDREKVSGVLVETRGVGSHRVVVIGAGINVNSAPVPGEVDRPATCLASHVGQDVERVEVARAVLKAMDRWLIRLRSGALSELHSAWLARCGMLNERVIVRCGEVVTVGRVLDVDPLGGLVLACDDGRQVRVPSERATLL